MSHGPEDDLLPWVVGGVLVLAMTIAVSAVAGSGDKQEVLESQRAATAVSSYDAGHTR